MAPDNAEQYDVFLSHSSRDKPWVGEFAQQLGERNLRVFYDADAIAAGGNFRDDIAEALFRTQTKLALLLTKHSIESGWVDWEFSLVANEDPANKKGRIVFVYLEDVREQLPPGWRYTASPVVLFDERRCRNEWERLLEALGLPPDAIAMPSLDTLRAAAAPQELPPAPRFVALHPPGPPREFFGRTDELGQLDGALLGAGRPPVVAVVGIGGQGKSTLVWQWLATRQPAIRHEVVFYSTAYRGGFSFIRFLEEALLELGEGRFDPKDYPTNEARVTRLIGLCRERPTLLVIDGLERWLRGWAETGELQAELRAEDLRPAAESGGLDLLLQEAATLTNGTQLLLTTRALPRALEGCALQRIATRAVDPEEEKLQGLDDDAALALLRSAKVKGNDGELRAAANEYGNHPLALRALAFNLRRMYGGDIARRPEVAHLVELDDKIGVLLSDLERHRSEDVPSLRVAALCFDKAPIPAIAAGIGEGAPGDADLRARMAALDRWGIVDFDGSKTGTVRLHPLIKKHFGATIEDAAPVHVRLCIYFAAISIPKTATRLEDVQPRILAIEHAQAGNKADVSQNLLLVVETGRCPNLADWLNSWGHYNFAALFLRGLIRRSSEYNRAAFLNAAGLCGLNHGDLHNAAKDFSDAIAIMRKLQVDQSQPEFKRDLSRSLLNRAVVHQQLHDLPSALKDCKDSIELITGLLNIKRSTELLIDLARLLTRRAMLHWEDSNLKAALADCEKSVAVRTELAEHEGGIERWRELANSLNDRSLVHHDNSNPESALVDSEKAVQIRRRLVEEEWRPDLRDDLAYTLYNRSLIRKRSNKKAAMRDMAEAQQLWRDLLAEDQHRHRAIFIKSLAIAAQRFDIPAGRQETAVQRVHEGLDILEAALSEADGWNEVLAREAANFFEWTGKVLDELRDAGLDLDRYERLRTAAHTAPSPPATPETAAPPD